MSSSHQFGELITALITPFDNELQLNIPVFKELAKMQYCAGVDSLVICGTTGESPTLSFEEKLELFKAALEVSQECKAQLNRPCSVIANVGSYCTQSSVKLAQAAAELGVDGLMAVVPYYNKPPQEGLYQHFKAIAKTSDLPLILYNIPGRSVVQLTVETIVRLAKDCPNIVGIKQALDSHEDARALLSELEGFQLYSGNDEQTLELMELGAQGVISTTSNIAPKLMADMCHSFSQGDKEVAYKLFEKLLPVMKGLFETSNPIMVKKCLELSGIKVGALRLPLVVANDKQSQRCAELLKVISDC